MQARTRYFPHRRRLARLPGRTGVIALWLLGLSACAPIAAIQSLSNPPPPPAPAAVPAVPNAGARIMQSDPDMPSPPVTGHDRSRQVYPEYTPYRPKPIPSYHGSAADRPQPTSPPTSVQIDRLEHRIDNLRDQIVGGASDRADWRLSRPTEGPGRAIDDVYSSRLRALERDRRAGR